MRLLGDSAKLKNDQLFPTQTQVKRRPFLTAATALTLSKFLGGCDRPADLKVELLKNTIPSQVVGKFRKQISGRVALDFTIQPKLDELFAQLQEWRRKAESPEATKPLKVADLVTLGDYWLAKAIQQQLIQPLNTDSLPQWQQLPAKWQELVRRNEKGELDPQGKIWAAPYQWGTTLIAYRVDKFKSLGWTPTDWKDLWREELRDRFSLLDQPREVIGLVLKKLGHSYNTLELDKVPNLKQELVELNRQVKFYSSSSYLQPLITGDTWLAVGWSGDILPLLKSKREIAAVIPQSGTALWANLWVKPAVTSSQDLADKWIDFCWQKQIAEQMSLITNTTSAIIPGINRNELPETLRKNELLLPPEAVLANSDFLHPLPPEIVEEYGKLWQEIRVSVI